VGELEGKQSLGRTRCEGSIEREIKRNRMGNWIDLAEGRDEWRVVVITVLNIKVGS
jgi:hypothetical protein